MKAIAFNAGDLFEKLQPGKPIDLAVEPQLNEWNGQVSVELEVKDISIPDADPEPQARAGEPLE
jgi:hypothetical protein